MEVGGGIFLYKMYIRLDFLFLRDLRFPEISPKNIRYNCQVNFLVL